MAKIRGVVVEGDRQTGYQRVQVLFGANSFIEITENDGRVMRRLGAHAGGVQADASNSTGQFAQLVRELIERHPESVWHEE